MVDKEKVIAELEDIQKHLNTGYSFAISWKSKLIRDTLELLKEQEPVKPRYTPPKSIYSWECGVCAEPFDRIANYCPKCGRRVKWE